jgi:hypothetical protein
MRDIVIPIGDGSSWNDNELRYCLRAVDKYAKDIGNVYLIGRKPSWVRNVNHIHVTDTPGPENKERNICNKVLAACNDARITPEFIFMNDDHFLLSEIPPLPFYYQQNLEASLVRRQIQDQYWNALNNTHRALVKEGFRTVNFDIHCPIIYDKEAFKQVMAMYDWTIPCGYVIKSLYCNTLEVTGMLEMDLKIKHRLNCFQLEALTKDRKFFSIDDMAICADMTTYLDYLYPDKSRYEL